MSNGSPDEEERFLTALSQLAPVEKEAEIDPITGRVSVRLGPGVTQLISIFVGTRTMSQVCLYIVYWNFSGVYACELLHAFAHGKGFAQEGSPTAKCKSAQPSPLPTPATPNSLLLAASGVLQQV